MRLTPPVTLFRSAALAAAPLALLLTACTPTDVEGNVGRTTPELSARPALENGADSLAWRIVESAGGLDAWHGLRRLRFDFAVVRDTVETFRARHLWDRPTGRYRVEYPVGQDSTLVALFNVQRFAPSAPEGAAFINGRPLDATPQQERLIEAHERFVNDSYWLLAPLKLFDPGVRRALAPDSARDAADVLLLSFDGVGLTPGDRYWLTADGAGRLMRWSFALEGGGQGTYRWEEPVRLPTPQGDLLLPTRKRTAGRAIRTPVHSAEGLPEDVFERPTPVL